ncbi:hypothetical protein VAS14_00226 [Vibrio angustum S14]|uniref:TIGR03756 family integrating conjugative element protein n=1 Tax=Photobacterium angustum (strain S14 / CCUG 15956) TaxID=314292 RepID=Q1ZJS4_PHOAS|nr:TraU family protein [Photobacterium angustum]EAS62448.1 hypothetical protein VAS14_00226 [Vibrio angustum S14] [Photobacterium angustum S14]
MKNIKLTLVAILMSSMAFADSPPPLNSGVDENGVPTTPSDSTLSIFELYQDSMANSFACTDYSVEGMCFWLKCSWTGCRVKTSMIVSHYNPDATIEVIQTQNKLPLSPVSEFFHDLGKNITEAIIPESEVFGIGQGLRSAGNETSSLGVPKQFHDAVAMGNPALPLYENSVGNILGTVGWCDSDVTLYKPFFVSTGSPEWRTGELEGAKAKLEIKKVTNSIGGGLSGYPKWGDLYPRIGTAYQRDNSKSAGTIASRVANIISSPQSLHIAQKLPITSGNNRTFDMLPGKEIRPNDERTAYFQQNFPKDSDKKCRVFPHQKLKRIQSDTQNYVWTLWRRYKCCAPKGQTYLGKVDY